MTRNYKKISELGSAGDFFKNQFKASKPKPKVVKLTKKGVPKKTPGRKAKPKRKEYKAGSAPWLKYSNSDDTDPRPEYSIYTDPQSQKPAWWDAYVKFNKSKKWNREKYEEFVCTSIELTWQRNESEAVLASNSRLKRSGRQSKERANANNQVGADF